MDTLKYGEERDLYVCLCVFHPINIWKTQEISFCPPPNWMEE